MAALVSKKLALSGFEFLFAGHPEKLCYVRLPSLNLRVIVTLISMKMFNHQFLFFVVFKIL